MSAALMRAIGWLFVFGLVWLFAYLNKPELTSGTVSFIAAVAATVAVNAGFWSADE